MAVWRLDLLSLDGSTQVASDVPFARFTLRWSLDDTGSAEINLREDQVGSGLWLPMQRRVVVRRDGAPVWAGILLGLEGRYEAGTVRCTARALGLRAWLERRVVHGDLTRTATVATTIAWDLIQHAQAQTDGGMGLVLGTVTGTAPARNRYYTDGQSIAEAIEELADLDTGGFDWELDAQGRFNAWVGGRGRSIGTRVSPMDHLADGGWKLQGDFTAADTYVTALGDDPDGPCGPPLVTVASSLLPPATYGRWESVVEHGNTDSSELAQRASEQLTQSARGRLRLHVARRGPWLFEERWQRTALGGDWTATHLDGTGSVTLPGDGSVIVDSRGTGAFDPGATSDTGSLVWRSGGNAPLRAEVDVLDPGVSQGGTGQGQCLLMLRALASPSPAADDPYFALRLDSDASHLTVAWRDTPGSTAAWLGENTGVPWDPAKPLRVALEWDASGACSAWVSQDQGATWALVGSRTMNAWPYPVIPCLTASSAGGGRVIYGPVRLGGTIWPGLGLGDRPIVVLARKNLVSNPGFEASSPLGSSSGGATISRVTTPVHSGNYALQVTTAGNGQTTQGWQTDDIPGPRGGETWTFSAWVKAPAGMPLRLILEWRLANSTGLGSPQKGWTASGDWERVSRTATAPRDTARVSLYVRQDGNYTTPYTFWLDDVQLEHGAVMTDWVDDQTVWGLSVRPTMRVVGCSVSLEPPDREWCEADLELV